MLVADLKRFGRELVLLSSHLVVSLADCALNVLEEREMRNLGKATRTLFVANSLVAELFAEFMAVFVFDALFVVETVVLVGEVVLLGNLRLLALV